MWAIIDTLRSGVACSTTVRLFDTMLNIFGSLATELSGQYTVVNLLYITVCNLVQNSIISPRTRHLAEMQEIPVALLDTAKGLQYAHYGAT